MFAFISGKAAYVENQYVAINAGGVGYKVFAPTRTLDEITVGQDLLLYTVLLVREDDMSLYGFADRQEKDMFEKLLTVSGVGPKVALAMLSQLTLAEIAQAALTGDNKAFSRVSGVGPKLAGRLVLEMKDKISAGDVAGYTVGMADPGGASAVSEAIEALVSLGYTRSDAMSAVADVKELADTAEELTLIALRRMAR